MDDNLREKNGREESIIERKIEGKSRKNKDKTKTI